MNKRSHSTEHGTIVYYVGNRVPDAPTLVFLPGLTATHLLFEKQIEYFEDRYNCLVWDAPAHGDSRPFDLSFTMEDKARWLHDILVKEALTDIVLVGQSMGGYVAQMYMELFPGSCRGFVSIDSCSLKRQYVTAFDLWALRRTEPMYRAFPWKLLKSLGANGCAVTEYGRALMHTMLSTWDRDSYCRVAGHGFKMLAEAIEARRAYDIRCPAVLLCGEKDSAGSARRYNKKWHRGEGLRLVMLPNAGHNSNTDAPEAVNAEIEAILRKL